MTCVPSKDSDQPGRSPSLITSLLCALWIAKDPKLLHTESEDDDHTGQIGFVMCWLILIDSQTDDPDFFIKFKQHILFSYNQKTRILVNYVRDGLNIIQHCYNILSFSLLVHNAI